MRLQVTLPNPKRYTHKATKVHEGKIGASTPSFVALGLSSL